MLAFFCLLLTIGFSCLAGWAYYYFMFFDQLTTWQYAVWTGLIGYLINLYGRSFYLALAIVSGILAVIFLFCFFVAFSNGGKRTAKHSDASISQEFIDGHPQKRYDLNVGSVLGDNVDGTPIQEILPGLIGTDPVLTLRVADGVILIYADGVNIGHVQMDYTALVLCDFPNIAEVGGLTVSQNGPLYSAQFYIIVK